jgi:hypothetical protein
MLDQWFDGALTDEAWRDARIALGLVPPRHWPVPTPASAAARNAGVNGRVVADSQLEVLNPWGGLGGLDPARAGDIKTFKRASLEETLLRPLFWRPWRSSGLPASVR